MPGANYMGGKRNAARARIKDAEGKVQRSHFGKKRFEVLRTGLSKGGAARNVPREPPEISLAHARRRGENELEDEHEWERNWTGLRSPSTSPVLHLRSPPLVNIASGRSKLLTKLDADDASVRRAQVEKILQTPDLLGLSRTKGLARSHKAAIDKPRSSREPIQQQRSSYNRHVSLKSPSIERSPSSTMTSHHQRTSSSRSRSRGRIATCSPARSSRLSSHEDESVFVPMLLDSSPRLYVDDSGYAEFWPDPHPDCKPTRVPFYAQSAHTSQRHSAVSPMSKRATSPSPTHLPRSSGFTTFPQFAALSHRQVSSGLSASPSCLELPSPLIEARFVSPMPSLPPEPSEPWQLSLSDTSGLSWSELASQSFLGSPDIPQASFSTSPPPFTGSRDAKGHGYSSDFQCKLAECAHDSSQGRLIGDAPENIAGPSAEEDTAQWDYVTLEDILGDLDADPWTALSKVLGLPSSPVGPSDTTEDIFTLLGTSDRRGAGYTGPTRLPSPQSLEDDYHEDSAPLYSGSIIPTPWPFLNEGYCDPFAVQEAREVESVESLMTESTALLHGTCLLPRCSRSPDPPCQRSVVFLTDRRETVVSAHQTAQSQEVLKNGEDFKSEAVRVGDRGSQYIALRFERDNNLGLVDGPSLFDNDDLWCSEG